MKIIPQLGNIYSSRDPAPVLAQFAKSIAFIDEMMMTAQGHTISVFNPVLAALETRPTIQGWQRPRRVRRILQRKMRFVDPNQIRMSGAISGNALDLTIDLTLIGHRSGSFDRITLELEAISKAPECLVGLLSQFDGRKIYVFFYVRLNFTPIT